MTCSAAARRVVEAVEACKDGGRGCYVVSTVVAETGTVAACGGDSTVVISSNRQRSECSV